MVKYPNKINGDSSLYLHPTWKPIIPTPLSPRFITRTVHNKYVLDLRVCRVSSVVCQLMVVSQNAHILKMSQCSKDKTSEDTPWYGSNPKESLEEMDNRRGKIKSSSVLTVKKCKKVFLGKQETLEVGSTVFWILPSKVDIFLLSIFCNFNYLCSIIVMIANKIMEIIS